MAHHQKAQAGYQPTGQATADQNFQGLQSTVSGAAGNLAATAPGQYQALYNNVASNPYYQQAQTGANEASAMGSGFVAPAQLQGAAAEMQQGNTAGAAASQAAGYMSQIMSGYGASPTSYVPQATSDAAKLYGALPAATAGYGHAGGAYDSAMGKAQDIYGAQTGMANNIYGLNMDMAGATIPGQLQAANQVMQTGFDPQRQLYDRGYQQMMEHQNAINAQQGVSGSPFAAGVSGDASRNFDIDWQNQALQRQLAALSGYSGAMTNATGNFNTLVNGGAGGTAGGLLNNAAGNYATLSGAGTDQFNSLTNGATGNLNSLVGSADSMMQNATHQQFADQQAAMNGAVQRYGEMAGTYGGLAGTQANQYANASDLGAAGLNTMTTAAMYPNQVYMNQQNQILQALNGMVGGTSQALAPANQAMTNDLNYMKTGQSATQLQQSAAQQNNAASSSMLGGFGQLAGLALAPFTGGMSLALPGMMGGGGAVGPQAQAAITAGMA